MIYRVYAVSKQACIVSTYIDTYLCICICICTYVAFHDLIPSNSKFCINRKWHINLERRGSPFQYPNAQWGHMEWVLRAAELRRLCKLTVKIIRFGYGHSLSPGAGLWLFKIISCTIWAPPAVLETRTKTNARLAAISGGFNDHAKWR